MFPFSRLMVLNPEIIYFTPTISKFTPLISENVPHNFSQLPMFGSLISCFGSCVRDLIILLPTLILLFPNYYLMRLFLNFVDCHLIFSLWFLLITVLLPNPKISSLVPSTNAFPPDFLRFTPERINVFHFSNFR